MSHRPEKASKPCRNCKALCFCGVATVQSLAVAAMERTKSRCCDVASARNRDVATSHLHEMAMLRRCICTKSRDVATSQLRDGHAAPRPSATAGRPRGSCRSVWRRASERLSCERFVAHRGGASERRGADAGGEKASPPTLARKAGTDGGDAVQRTLSASRTGSGGGRPADRTSCARRRGSHGSACRRA